ncbi:serine/threonine-protein kinase [Nocardioides dongxiaopingii]|uniref:serine/threonine-protein kinase n=1 Tax=Nocardioides dongxiaopingii TaxID=2576036 RepID=UPI0010C7621B|nr:serine/threonine-protein kinase [Nocardioides dongxiaopingii]
MIGDRYSLDREIGRGGMGAVWLGRDELLGRPVAIKRVGVMPGGSSPDLMRAEREARIAASLNHPNIVGIYDLAHDADQQYLVMEYVEGSTLAELVRERGPLPTREAARILSQAASALAAAHASQIVHRDVKPSNILVRSDGEVKLSDFGIARMTADPSLTQTGLVTGSPAYLAPEVASGTQATPASDVWSLGATLFHALSGAPPYDVGDNVLGALYQIVNEPPPRLPNPGEMAPVLLATMAHDPQRRWAMEDVARVLELLAHSDPDASPLPDPGPATPDVTALHRAAPVGGTRALRPAPEPAPEPVPAPVEPPAPDRGVAPPARAARRRRPVLPLLVAALVVLLVGVIGALILTDDPQDEATPPGVATSSDPPSTAPSSEPTSATSSPSTAPSEEEIRTFVVGYLRTASKDPEAGFEMLTPKYQAESPEYDSFWGSVSNPRVEAFSADPETLVATYTYTYNLRGAGTKTEQVRLQLVQDDTGALLIDGAS